MTEVRQVLEKMRAWIQTELEKAKQPRAERFVLMSLGYCADQVEKDPATGEKVLALLRSVTKEERLPTYDVVGPQGALFIINRTLATKC